MTKAADRILEGSATSAVATAAVKIAGDTLAEIESSLPRALAGDRQQVRLYLDAYNRLTERMLEAVGDAPTVPWLAPVLQGEAMNAPFSDWVGSLGAGRGTALAVVALLRDTLPAAKPLARPARRRLPDWNLKDGDVLRFYRAVATMLGEGESPLERITAVFGLNRTEAARLFGVRRQALEGWERSGVPVERQAKLASIDAIADLLGAQLKEERIAAAVRRPAPAYGNRSILEAIAAGDEEQVLDALRSAFDWASAA